jgi:hypothetical protein
MAVPLFRNGQKLTAGKPVQLQLSAQNGGVDRQMKKKQITDKLSGQTVLNPFLGSSVPWTDTKAKCHHLN